MADIGSGTRSKIIGTVGIAAVIGTRCYPGHLPQNPTLPAVTYDIVSGVDELHLKGLVGIQHARIQIDSYASTRLAANSLSTAIRDAIADDGDAGRGTWGTVGVCGCAPAGGERYGEQPKGDGSDERDYITSRDYLISFNG